MNGQYDVVFQNDVVGQVMVERDGLYYQIRCSVQLKEQRFYRLWLKTENDRIDLGLCVPKEGTFYLNKRIPIKVFPAIMGNFVISDSRELEKSLFIPVDESKAFSAISKLRQGKFVIQNGIPGIMITELSDGHR